LGSLEFSYINAIGRFEGNIIEWEKKSFTCTNSWAFSSGLGSSLFSLDLEKEITLLNIYGPYMERLEYWDTIFSSEWFQKGLVIVWGDLNFTLGALEVWGLATQVDCMSSYFINKLEEVGLLDIEPTKLTST